MSSASSQCASFIKSNEGYVQCVYNDSLGNPTVCWGHLLTGGGSGCLSQSQCQSYFSNDYATAYSGAQTVVNNFSSLTPARQCVLIDMTFNLGLGGLKSFSQFLSYVQSGNYAAAASDMLHTQWASQVHGRANRDSAMMSSGNFQ